MLTQDRSTNTDRQPPIGSRQLICGIKAKDLVQIISQLLLPLVLAVFTIIITFDQRNENRIQRLQDRRSAEEQRSQDLNISREQRLEDRETAREQRENDRFIAAEKRAADDLNADLQRNMTRDQRIYEVDIEQERYKKDHAKYLDSLLLSYYNEMGELLQKLSNVSLSSHTIIFSLARAKTLNVIEQVGPARASSLVMFLYDAGQLSIDIGPLDLTEAYLNSIDLRRQRTLTKLHLSGAHLNNAVFDGQDLSYANFQDAKLRKASFKGAICTGARFDGADLSQADFAGANITLASFVHSNLQEAMFQKAAGSNPLFQSARMQRTNFTDCRLSFQSGVTSGFIDSNLAASSFDRAIFINAWFVYCNMMQVDFAHADLSRANMTGSDMSYGSFLNTEFGFTDLSGTNFSHANLSTIVCTEPIPSFSSCRLRKVLSLAHAHLSNQSFGLPPTPFFSHKENPQCPRPADMYVDNCFIQRSFVG